MPSTLSIGETPLGVNRIYRRKVGGTMSNRTPPRSGDLPPNDGEWVYCRRFRHWRTGQWVYPKTAKFFRFRRRK